MVGFISLKNRTERFRSNSLFILYANLHVSETGMSSFSSRLVCTCLHTCLLGVPPLASAAGGATFGAEQEYTIFVMKLLCCLPVRWPLSPSAQLAVDTWLSDCDESFLAVSRAQLAVRNVSLLRAARGKSIAVIATHEDHQMGKLDVWLPVRSAIAHASALLLAKGTADWLVVAEDDSYLLIARLRTFLAGFEPTVPKFLGACSCGRCPGAFVLSAAAIRAHSRDISACAPDHRGDRYSRGLGCKPARPRTHECHAARTYATPTSSTRRYRVRRQRPYHRDVPGRRWPPLHRCTQRTASIGLSHGRDGLAE